ncbi:MAG TPA: hypothetical protein VED37_10875 [Ktedonobacteraceae bacterium]|nr:hypothetical protein [Ktedonobacteraceae bacterium]
MLPGNDEKDTIEGEIGQRELWNRSFRCSICTNFMFFSSILLKEPVDAPVPRQEWTLCKACYEAILMEMRRSTIHSPIRLRIVVGLVAAERSPHSYVVDTRTREQREFDREFAWFVWAMVIFGLLHVAIFAVLLAIPR